MTEAPFFVVGCARSGTTLVRWMLEEHPRLAIPPESKWVVELADARLCWSRVREAELLRGILDHRRFRRWKLSRSEVEAAVGRQQPGSYAGLVRAVFSAYAEQKGKPRWGDKTPEYVREIDLLADLFPDAVFVHVIRDGRHVAASLVDQGWSGDSIEESAAWWKENVTLGQGAGERLGPARYCEVRLEDLVAEPEVTLRRICAFLGETYTQRLLEYPRRAWELGRWSPSERWSHRHLASPPTPELRDWGAGLPARRKEAVEAICEPLLEDLGYPPERRS